MQLTHFSIALDSFPIPAKECWRWRCFLVLDFVCFMLNRNPAVKKHILIYDTQLICNPGTRPTRNRSTKFRIKLKQSWSTINASSAALEIQIQRKIQITKVRIDETELIYNPGIVGWQSGAKLTHAPLCQHNCLDQQTQIQLQIQIQKNTNTNSHTLPRLVPAQSPWWTNTNKDKTWNTETINK